MAIWVTPSNLSPGYRFIIADDGVTCTNAEPQDGSVADPAQYQSLYDQTLSACKLMNTVEGLITDSLPDSTTTVFVANGAVTVSVDAADLSAVQGLITTNFAGQPVTATTTP